MDQERVQTIDFARILLEVKYCGGGWYRSEGETYRGRRLSTIVTKQPDIEELRPLCGEDAYAILRQENGWVEVCYVALDSTESQEGRNQLIDDYFREEFGTFAH